MHNNKTLTIKNLGIDTYRENIIYMRSDCHVCRSEGFTALTRVVVHCMDRSIVATLNVVQSELLRHGEAGLSTVAIKRLEAKKDNKITVSHLQPIPSVGLVRVSERRSIIIFFKRLDARSEMLDFSANGKYKD